ncbi:AMP-binding protein, partial [Roseibium sp. RKSG952]|uniref:AMP-binding protein n=1 Tax=Roseibium sp. RKSG952 TaxID=2529384 RepID=UPI0012BD50FB
FDRSTAERLSAMFVRLLEAVSEAPETRLIDLPLLDKAEEAVLLGDFNATAEDFALDQTVVDLFAGQVKASPGAIAVVDGEGQLTYAEVDAASNRLARHLMARGVGPESVVGVCLDRSTALMTALLAIFKAGGAYLPLDPAYPEERLAFIVEDAGVEVVVTNAELSGGHRGLAGKGLMLDTAETQRALARCSGTAVTDAERSAPLTPLTLAYILYTSGSTGKPKGVMVGHRELTNRLSWMQEDVPIGPGDVVLQKTPYTFDVSVWEFFWWACHGAQLVMLAPGAHRDAGAVAEAMERHGVTALHFVPSLFDTYLDLLEAGEGLGSLPHLRAVFTSGEALSARAVERFHKVARTEWAGTVLRNLYGPTEAAVDVTAYGTQGGED